MKVGDPVPPLLMEMERETLWSEDRLYREGNHYTANVCSMQHPHEGKHVAWEMCSYCGSSRKMCGEKKKNPRIIAMWNQDRDEQTTC